MYSTAINTLTYYIAPQVIYSLINRVIEYSTALTYSRADNQSPYNLSLLYNRILSQYNPSSIYCHVLSAINDSEPLPIPVAPAGVTQAESPEIIDSEQANHIHNYTAIPFVLGVFNCLDLKNLIIKDHKVSLKDIMSLFSVNKDIVNEKINIIQDLVRIIIKFSSPRDTHFLEKRLEFAKQFGDYRLTVNIKEDRTRTTASNCEFIEFVKNPENSELINRIVALRTNDNCDIITDLFGCFPPEPFPTIASNLTSICLGESIAYSVKTIRSFPHLTFFSIQKIDGYFTLENLPNLKKVYCKHISQSGSLTLRNLSSLTEISIESLEHNIISTDSDLPSLESIRCEKIRARLGGYEPLLSIPSSVKLLFFGTVVSLHNLVFPEKLPNLEELTFKLLSLHNNNTLDHLPKKLPSLQRVTYPEGLEGSLLAQFQDLENQIEKSTQKYSQRF